MGKVEAIRKLVAVGRAKDVLDLVEGESSYISEGSLGAPQEPEFRRLWILVVHHLRFVSEFGVPSSGEHKDGKHYAAFPDAFDQWLQAGAPGISSEDLSAFLKDHPL
ncbi:hypothetical protein [Pseudomonas rubra]|uniref:Uncharacterized protein n=1 Tax=Pseudomonas rubra TaxID=2942627 RepID=A0ABT5PH66_9PSED|nr:hypothetical protein [Pseudomonas rubra]MDD1017373.1 hypothetical protein [Pseudomonas rubra]MDD1041795.1 hypothetical protein [Pseudomonas rubra]MDD1158088.1 hypothetical protein [Pseudomonas rubra]